MTSVKTKKCFIAFVLAHILGRKNWWNLWAWKSNGKGRLSTVDLLLIISLDRLVFVMKILFTFLQKQATSMRRSTVLSLSPSVSIPLFKGTLNLLDVVGSL